MGKNTEEEMLKTITKVSIGKGEMVSSMIRATLVMLKAMDKILCEMDAKINKGD